MLEAYKKYILLKQGKVHSCKINSNLYISTCRFQHFLNTHLMLLTDILHMLLLRVVKSKNFFVNSKYSNEAAKGIVCKCLMWNLCINDSVVKF